ncbi:MAG: L-arabinose isomerase [Lapillicoccus sp.]
MKDQPQQHIWFLTGSQDLYGQDTLDQVARQSREVAEALDASNEVPVQVVWKPVLKDSDSIRAAVLDANRDDLCIGLIAWMHTFSPAKMWIRGLTSLQKPLLHLHTQANVELPWATIDMDFMNLNQAAHGDREFAYIQSRLGMERTIVVGHVSDPRVTSRVGVWTRAAAGNATARSLRLARFGDTMRNVADTEGDKTEAEVRFGISVNSWSVNELVERVDAVGGQELDAVVDEYEQCYDVVPELRAGGARHASLRYAAQQELGLRSFLEDGGFEAFTTNFEDLGGLRQLPGVAVQRLMADGYGFGAEGDWKTAAMVRVAKVMGRGLPGGASLMEDYSYDLTPGRELILGAHMLEVCPSLTTATPSLQIHPLGIGDRDDPVRLVFDADPGPAVVVGMTDMRDRFRLTANVIDVVRPPHPLPALPVARAVWSPTPDFITATQAWLMAGSTHHTVMTTAVAVDAFEALAQMMKTELLIIDQDTTVRSFARDLRGNAAYYRIAEGL